MISGIPLILGLGTRMSDPFLYVVFWAPIYDRHSVVHLVRSLFTFSFR